MSADLRYIFRHPIKGIGSEALGSAKLSPDGALHGDRAWALLNAAAPDSDDWQPRRNFLQVASGPALARIRAKSVEAGICLSHPDKEDLTLNPAQGGASLADWLADLWPGDRPGPGRLVRAPGHGMTDMPDPFVSIGNLASLRALSDRSGRTLDLRRFRINLWIEGWAPWEEFDLVGETITIGPVSLVGAEPIGRCRAPEANPDTGQRDLNTNRTLEDGWGHTDFGLYARSVTAGEVSLGDAAIVL